MSEPNLEAFRSLLRAEGADPYSLSLETLQGRQIERTGPKRAL